MNICIVEKDIKEIELIKPLWEQLNSVHFAKSVHFKDKYEKFTFDKRMKSIYEKAQKGIVKLDMISDGDTGSYVGYSLSSIENNRGEIESIYIENKYRKLGLGGKLMENSLNWFKANRVTNIQIGVVYANDEALSFYERFGFYIGNYIIKRK
jgi:diamine N-acetyltransferase